MVTGLCHHLSMAGGFISARMGAAGGERSCSKPFLPSALHHPRWGWGLCRGILTPTRAALSRGAGAERDVLDPRVQPRGGAAQLPPPGGQPAPVGPAGTGTLRGSMRGLLLCGGWLLAASYVLGGCRHRCCPGRNNACWAPGTHRARCYCDSYCERTGDCCQDYQASCRRAGECGDGERGSGSAPRLQACGADPSGFWGAARAGPRLAGDGRCLSLAQPVTMGDSRVVTSR